VVAEQLRIEIAAEFFVDPRQQVEIECGGNAVGIVVRRFQHANVLLQIGADQHAAMIAREFCNPSQQPERLGRFEIADRRTRKIDQRTRRMALRRRQRKRGREIGADRQHLHFRVGRRELFGDVHQVVA